MSSVRTTAASGTTGWKPSLDAYEPSLVTAAEACARFVADMEGGAEPYWLTLSGVNGCGKTMLMGQVFEQAKRVNPGNPANNRIWPPDWERFESGAVNVYVPARPYCIALTEAKLAERMRGGEYELPASLHGDWFVSLDELGVERDPTNFVANAVSKLAEQRMHRWTMFATNLTLTEIRDRIDARVTSRMIRDANLFVTIAASDYALRA